MSYKSEITSGQGLTIGKRVDIVATLDGDIVWIDEETGKKEHVMRVCSYGADKRSESRLRKSMQAQINIQLGRLRAHLKNTGKRWEVEREQERLRTKAINAAPHTAKERIVNAVVDVERAGTTPELPWGSLAHHDDDGLEKIAIAALFEVRRRAKAKAEAA